jgi:hypothetical protein
MRPRSISASALLVFLGCRSRFYYENVLRAKDISNSAADLGTVCHAVLERWVKNGWHLVPDKKFSAMQALYVEEYFKLFTDTDRYEEGLGLLEKWYNRQDWDDRQVISTEEKLHFDVPVKLTSETGVVEDGVITFNYIMDRMDLRSDGIIEVVDYKTIMRPMQPDELPHKIQPRAYGLAAQLQNKDAPKVRVTFDLLRYDKVGVTFTKEDNRNTWLQIRSIAQEIINDEPDPSKADDPTYVWPAETINLECKYCIRKADCKTLQAHVDAGGLKGTDLLRDETAVGRIVDLRSNVKWRMDALKMLQEELDTMVMEYMQDLDLRELTGNATQVSIKARQKRAIEPGVVRDIVGESKFAEYATIGTGAVDKMLKNDPDLTDEQKAAVKTRMTKVYGGRWLDSQPVGLLDEAEG